LIYRHPDGARCARIARTNHAFDVLGRAEDTRAEPPTGPLRKGEIVVANSATGRLAASVGAFRLIVQAVPIYAPARLLLASRRFRDLAEREMGGGDDGACEVDPA